MSYTIQPEELSDITAMYIDFGLIITLTPTKLISVLSWKPLLISRIINRLSNKLAG